MKPLWMFGALALIIIISGCDLFTRLTTDTGMPGTYFGMSKASALEELKRKDKVIDVWEDFIFARGVWEVTRDERLKMFTFQGDRLVKVDYLLLKSRSDDPKTGALQRSGVPLDQIIDRAREGDPDAQHTLCYAFVNGGGVDRNDRLAFRWCTAAAKQGQPSSQTLLAELYAEGHGTPKNYPAAFELYLKAAEAGHPHAQLMVGELYLAGAGTTRDPIKAKYWMQKSADQGYVLAKKRLTEIK